jgi:hypothetical protein
MFLAYYLCKTDHNYNYCICGGVSDGCLLARQNDDHVPSCHEHLLEIMLLLKSLVQQDLLFADIMMERRHQLLEKQFQLDLLDMCQALLGLFLNDATYGARTLICDAVRCVIYKTIHHTK